MFSDCSNPVVGFDKTQVLSKKTEDVSVSTTEYQLKENTTQTGNMKSISVQTDPFVCATTVKYDEKGLLEFLKKVTPQLEAHLQKRTTIPLLTAKNEHSETDVNFQDCAVKIAALPKHQFHNDKMFVRHLSWNSSGDTIAASLIYGKHENWCNHTSYILIYKLNKNKEFLKEFEREFEIRSCITDIRFHTESPYMFAASTKSGKIYVCTFRYNQTGELFHLNFKNNDSICGINWIKFENHICLAACGEEGTMSVWKVSEYQHHEELAHYVFRADDGKQYTGIQCFDFSHTNEYCFVVAVDGGLLLGCFAGKKTQLQTDDSQNAAVFTYQKFSPIMISIRFSPIVDEFAVSYLNESIRIFVFGKKEPIHTICPEYGILGLDWDFHQRDVLKTWALNGNIYFYFIPTGTSVDKFHITDQSITSVVSVRQDDKQYLAAVDGAGIISIWQIPYSVSLRSLNAIG